MKATGIVRRIDDLGRVVIPKEIRRTFHIKEGDSLEIYTDAQGEVIFKKYSPMNELPELAKQICESLQKTVGGTCAVCDRDSVIAAAGTGKKDILGKGISAALEQIMENRSVYRCRTGVNLPCLTEESEPTLGIAAPVIASGDVMGCVIILREKGIDCGETEAKLAQTVAGFLGKQMEE